MSENGIDSSLMQAQPFLTTQVTTLIFVLLGALVVSGSLILWVGNNDVPKSTVDLIGSGMIIAPVLVGVGVAYYLYQR
jgi:imidazolonepropionase-like amidohydrolase